jgi:oligosaccharide repeat unit polymerase
MVGLYLPIESGDVRLMAASFVASWLLLLTVLSRSERGGLYRPCTAYLMLFGLFHGGLILSVALRVTPTVSDDPAAWLLWPHAVVAVKLSILGMAAFALGAELMGGRPKEITRPRKLDEPALRQAFVLVGLTLELLGVAVFMATVFAAGGLSLVVGGYDAFLEVAGANPRIGYAITSIGVGAVLAVVGGGRARKSAWIIYLVYAAIAFPIGLRGEVLFGLLALLVVEARLGRRLRALWTAIGGGVILVLIAFVRQTRTLSTGAAVSSSSPQAMILEAIAEMGYSLRPTVVVVGWHSLNEPYMDGATFMAVPIRFIERMFGHGFPEYDPRLFNVEIAHRVGPIGGSPIAEAYHNFGTTGVVCFMLALGAVIGVLERQTLDAVGAAAVGVVLIPLLTQIRNSFASVLVDIGLGVITLLACRLYASKRRPWDVVPTGRPT